MEVDQKILAAKLAVADYQKTADPCLIRIFGAITEELDRMSVVRNPQLFTPYYPKGLADCPDFPNDLKHLLLDLLDDYFQMKTE